MGERGIQTIIIMGLNFRGQSARFKNETSNKNKAGFQEKSAAGPRQGVGGDEPGSLAKAEARFSQRSGPSHKSSPITQKSKSSPLKINETLIEGANLTNKKFLDVGEVVGEAFSKKSKGKAKAKTKTTEPKTQPSAPKEKVDVPEIIPTKTIDPNMGATTTFPTTLA
jgi:hypothetical protein